MIATLRKHTTVFEASTKLASVDIMQSVTAKRWQCGGKKCFVSWFKKIQTTAHRGVDMASEIRFSGIPRVQWLSTLHQSCLFNSASAQTD